MRMTIESTDRIVTLVAGAAGEVPARVWEGHTESGVPVIVFITRVAVRLDQDRSQFDRELEPHRPPSAEVAAWPSRMVL